MTQRVCSVDGCDRPHRAKGYCKRHWQQHRRRGFAVMRPEVTEFDRFIERVAPNEAGCWIWTGPQHPLGYGEFSSKGERRAHRWSYTFFVGPIPDGLTIDHMCCVPACVNPDHLAAVTIQENLRRKSLTYMTCKRGHDLTDPANYRLTAGNGRDCRECERLRRAERARSVVRDAEGHSFDPSDPRHGKESSYTRRYCRCERCTKAASAKCMERQRRIRAARDEAVRL